MCMYQTSIRNSEVYTVKYMGIVSVLALLTVIGCSALEEQLRCAPHDSQECIGWLGDKPIYLEEEL